MQSYKLSELNRTQVDNLKARPRIDFSSIFGVVSLHHIAQILNYFPVLLSYEYFHDFILSNLYYWHKSDIILALNQVQPIVDDVRSRGDAAVKESVFHYFMLMLYHFVMRTEEKPNGSFNTRIEQCAELWGSKMLDVNCVIVEYVEKIEHVVVL